MFGKHDTTYIDARIVTMSRSPLQRALMTKSLPAPLSIGNIHYDAPTVKALIAFIKIAQEIPDCIDSHCHDEIGRFLLPLAQLISTNIGENNTESWGQWNEQLKKSSNGRQQNLHSWLGENLSILTKENAPLYAALLLQLETIRDEDTLANTMILELQRAFDLNNLEIRILDLAGAMSFSPFTWEYISIERPAYKRFRAVAAALNATPQEVIDALEPTDKLIQTGIFKVSEKVPACLEHLMGLSRFGRHLFSHTTHSCTDFIGANVELFNAEESYATLQLQKSTTEQRMALAIINTGLTSKEKGINVLLCGSNKTGKAQFVAELLQMISCTAYEVPIKNSLHANLAGIDRLKRLDLAQRALGANTPTIFVVNQAEDMLHTEIKKLSVEAHLTGSKGNILWIQNFLKINAHPIIWSCNLPNQIVPADLQGFTMLVHFDAEDANIRRKQTRNHLAPIGISESVISSIAQRKEFNTELLTSSARVVQLTQGKAGALDEIVMCHLNNQAKAMQLPTVTTIRPMNTRFDINYLQVQGRFSADQVMAAIVRNRTGTLLMGGPPGTGKTQLARVIADRLSRSLICLTASDINTKWYGESEKKVASIFQNCDPLEQVIFLDEAETVLAARGNEEHRASQSVTAEFLRQLDAFTGVFICATNHAAMFDPALIRRFTFRLEFMPLTRLQREMMLLELANELADKSAARLNGDELPENSKQHLARLTGLTPGDFANVKRRFELLGHTPSLDDWLQELQEEWKAKPGHHSGFAMGFS
jgi:hypothetical protein